MQPILDLVDSSGRWAGLHDETTDYGHLPPPSGRWLLDRTCTGTSCRRLPSFPTKMQNPTTRGQGTFDLALTSTSFCVRYR